MIAKQPEQLVCVGVAKKVLFLFCVVEEPRREAAWKDFLPLPLKQAAR